MTCQSLYLFSDPSELDLVLVIVSLLVGFTIVMVTLLLVWPSPGNLAAPLSISTTSLLWVCARWR